MRHHHFNPERFDGDNQGYEPPHRHNSGWHIELGNMGYEQHSQYERMYGHRHNHFHWSLPYMEVPPGFEPSRQIPAPSYGSSETNYYQHSRPAQGQIEFSDPYHQHHQYYPNEQLPQHAHHHRNHRGHHAQYQPENQEYLNIPPTDDNRHVRRSIYTYDGAERANPEQAMASARVVAEVARRMGVDPVVAVAAMLVESGGNPRAVGDNGHSFGLFQLNARGELAEARLSPNQAFNPRINAEVALSYFHKGHTNNPGAMAAAAQRPANRADYARKVNSNMAEAEQMVRAMRLA